MGCAVVRIIYGVPLTEPILELIQRWEDSEDERYVEDKEGRTCGFVRLYSTGGGDPYGFCGLELCKLDSYSPQQIVKLNLIPNEEQIKKVQKMFDKLDPDIKQILLTRETWIGVWTIWSDT